MDEQIEITLQDVIDLLRAIAEELKKDPDPTMREKMAATLSLYWKALAQSEALKAKVVIGTLDSLPSWRNAKICG